jgi:flagellar motor switch protein FliG
MASGAAKLSGLKKAAIFLVSMGEQASAELMKQLNEEEVKTLSKAIARLETVPPDQAEAVLEEVYSTVLPQPGSARGGVQYAKKVLASAFGADNARRIAEHLPKPNGQVTKNIEALQKADPMQLSRFLEGEHPQTIALILAHLSTTQAASLLASLNSGVRSEVVVRMAELDRVSPDVVAHIAVVISERMKYFGEIKRETYRGPRAVAEILNRMDPLETDVILNDIEDQQGLVDAIRHYMFVFDDLLMIDPKAMKEVVAKIDRKLLIVALKGTSEQLKQHFFQCMSQRGAEMLREDMEAMGPVKIKDVEMSQQGILAVIRQLESEGVLSLRGGAEEQYVV